MGNWYFWFAPPSPLSEKSLACGHWQLFHGPRCQLSYNPPLHFDQGAPCGKDEREILSHPAGNVLNRSILDCLAINVYTGLETYCWFLSIDPCNSDSPLQFVHCGGNPQFQFEEG